MKKIVTVLALASTSAIPALAQEANVTVFGVADTFVGGWRNIVATQPTATNPFGARMETERTTGMGTYGINASRFGFRGTEDLGGGLKASFVLENQVGLDTGAAPARLFHRQIWVALSGNWGKVGFGRQYTAWNDVASNAAPGYGDTFDPYVRVWRIGGPAPLGSPTATGGATGLSAAIGSNNDVGNPTVWNQTRMDNSIRYDTPNINGFRGIVQIGFPEGIGAQNKTLSSSAGVYYDNNKWRVGVAYHGQNSGIGGRQGDNDSLVLAANYDFGPAKIWSMVNFSKYDVFTLNRRLTSREWSLGVSAPFGEKTVFKAGAAGSSSSDLDGHDIGYGMELHYNLSKRTAIYGAYSWSRWGELLNGQDNKTGYVYGVGLRHFW